MAGKKGRDSIWHDGCCWPCRAPVPHIGKEGGGTAAQEALGMAPTFHCCQQGRKMVAWGVGGGLGGGTCAPAVS